MGYKLIVSRDAHEDLAGIIGYITNELANREAAASFLDEVEERYNRVINNPHIYALCNDARLERMGYRKIVIKNYLILYRIDVENKTVYIVRIVYGGRDYPELL
ncbi:MAG TPA: type II toxin-antitoxin system RelE/ParE family toxin [Desulfobulbaceae bacterium]|nr:type II toxin-antitoxin system RelE/ParE family toxin [Desulfobulbaceae bacterium]